MVVERFEGLSDITVEIFASLVFPTNRVDQTIVMSRTEYQNQELDRLLAGIKRDLLEYFFEPEQIRN